MLKILARNPNEFIAYCLSCALILGVGFMFIYQIVILLMNKTTMEVSLDPKHAPFRHESMAKNIKMVFGDRKRFWFSPFHEPFPHMKFV